MQNYIGRQIDRYRITERLGQGGMAVVYRAYDTRLERDVALKLIRTDAIPAEQHDRLMKRFEREAKSQAKFMHRHIIPVYDYGEVDGAPYLVMSYVPGGTLKQKITGPMDWRQAVRWLIPIAEALAYAHQRGVIHRDVKPNNILFDDEGQPILTDFGIAKILETDEATLTGTGLGVGTPEYMAPEQWRGQVSEATDQYGLGVVLYELITGQKPYSAETPAAVAILQAMDPLTAPSRIVNGIPKAVEKVLYKTLSRDPQDRYENMHDFQGALEGLLADGFSTSSAQPKVEAVVPPIIMPGPSVIDSESKTYDVLKTGIKKSKSKPPIPTRVWTVGSALILTVITIVGLLLSTRYDIQPKQLGFVETNTPRKITASKIPELQATRTRTPTKTRTPTQAPIFTINIESMTENPKDSAQMVYVPKGEFLMGSNDQGVKSDEFPENTVYLDAYWIYQHEVTNSQFATFLNEEGNRTEGGITWLDSNSSYTHIQQSNSRWTPDTDFADHPVVEVSWYGAQAYCQWAGGRLPTEAEWEKAARGTDGRTYPWGEETPKCDLANYRGCVGTTTEVGYYPNGTSPYGVLDMAGNVWEWVADWYDATYYSQNVSTNPKGPTNGIYHILRGGSWNVDGENLRTSFRLIYNHRTAYSYYGFRCVRSEEP